MYRVAEKISDGLFVVVLVLQTAWKLFAGVVEKKPFGSMLFEKSKEVSINFACFSTDHQADLSHYHMHMSLTLCIVSPFTIDPRPLYLVILGDSRILWEHFELECWRHEFLWGLRASEHEKRALSKALKPPWICHSYSGSVGT